MAAGRPVVSFQGSAKILDHNKTGYIVENANYDEFVKGILYLLDNCQIAESLGSNAQKVIDTKFSWSSKAIEIMAVYENVLQTYQSK